MSKAIIARGCEALTAELRVRFRKQVAPGDALCIRGWVVEKRKRRILAEAVLRTATGEEYAHAWAAFLVLPGASC
jgi:acyl-coenzyme A thioesterase PaaI-like protein